MPNMPRPSCRAAAHLRSIIADILDVTRIERGTLHLVEQDMDASEIVEISYKMCREQAKACRHAALASTSTDRGDSPATSRAFARC